VVARWRRRGDPDVVPDVGALLRAYRDRTGLSTRELERRTGGVVSYQMISRLENGHVRAFPTNETILALSEAIGVDVTTVVLGYAKSLGLPVRRIGPALVLPQDVDLLTDEQQRYIRDTIRLYLESPEVKAKRVAMRQRARHDAKRKRQPRAVETAESDGERADG
jgi:transcriptional regulator with XRE-family HTH domain